jgi:fructoselysine-6-P-deglycase FrlB-like protein
MIATAYLAIERVAVALGRDPDRPRLLKKVTETT